MKRIICLLLTVMMVLSMAACGKKPAGAPEAPEAPVETASYPVTVTDQAGREVVIEELPEKVVSGYYISTSALIALGQHSKMVGIEAKADKRAIYSLAAPELIELPSVGSAKEFDLEGCIALEPDLVILPMKLKDAAATMEEMEIDVLLVNPEDQTLLTEMIDLLGAALDCADAAETLNAYTDNVAAQLQDAVSSEEAPTVYLAGNSSFLSTAPDGMYQSDLIALAGGVNVAAEIDDTYWVDVSYEQVLAWDPEYIILASDASYTVEDVLADPALAGCTAIENGNVYQMPSAAEAWDSPVPGGVLGALWMGSKLHGEAVAEETVSATIGEFYETFYGFTYPA